MIPSTQVGAADQLREAVVSVETLLVAPRVRSCLVPEAGSRDGDPEIVVAEHIPMMPKIVFGCQAITRDSVMATDAFKRVKRKLGLNCCEYRMVSPDVTTIVLSRLIGTTAPFRPMGRARLFPSGEEKGIGRSNEYEQLQILALDEVASHLSLNRLAQFFPIYEIRRRLFKRTVDTNICRIYVIADTGGNGRSFKR